MAFRGNNHGGNGKTGPEVRAQQIRFIEAAATNAISAEDAALKAGYSAAYADQPGEILSAARRSGALQEALSKHGLDENYLVGEYKEAVRMAGEDGAKNKDLNAKAQLLKNLGFLMGHGKRETPQVAVQINNSVGKGEAPLDDARTIEVLKRIIGEEISTRESTGLSEQSTNPVDTEVQAHSGVVQSRGPGEKSPGRGKS